MVPCGITIPEVQPDTWQGSLAPESVPLRMPRLPLTTFSPLTCYYSAELRPEQDKSVSTGETPGAPEIPPQAAWGCLPEGGPALGLRSKLFLSCGSRDPQWEGRDVDQELGGRGMLQRQRTKYH